MNRICPVSCMIVENAIKAHEERGVAMGEYIDYHKASCAYCLTCTRNETSELPAHMRTDHGGVSDGDTD